MPHDASLIESCKLSGVDKLMPWFWADEKANKLAAWQRETLQLHQQIKSRRPRGLKAAYGVPVHNADRVATLTSLGNDLCLLLRGPSPRPTSNGGHFQPLSRRRQMRRAEGAA
jgi:hypothetical protein